jgi:triosephosphate isomerase
MNAARKPLIAGNWKMNTDSAGGAKLAAEVAAGAAGADSVEVLVCPPFPYLAGIAKVVAGGPVKVGAQNLYFEKGGAFTGEVSAAMLLDVGCSHVILGHSERRHIPALAETDAVINKKVAAALNAGLTPILCVGEKLEERDAGKTFPVIETQLDGGLAGLSAAEVGKMVIAYEPVWAIGTGRNATPEQAQEVHGFIRGKLGAKFGGSVAGAVRIQYGGSVKPDNAAELLSRPDVDGALVGGASLKSADFLAIVQAARG